MRGAARANVRRQAEDRDAQLARAQRAARERVMREVHVDADGHVRGILFRWKKARNGNRSPLFQVGITSLQSGDVVNTTVSINLHGLDEAWRRAVDFYANHRQIPKGSHAYRELLRAKPAPTVLQRAPPAAAATAARPSPHPGPGQGPRTRTPPGLKLAPVRFRYRHLCCVALLGLAACTDNRLQLADGTNTAWSQWAGQCVAINYWAEWCVPCRAEIPELNALHHERGATGLAILGVNYDGISGESLATLTAEMGIEFPVLVFRPVRTLRLSRTRRTAHNGDHRPGQRCPRHPDRATDAGKPASRRAGGGANTHLISRCRSRISQT